jgi:hypothetical protein
VILTAAHCLESYGKHPDDVLVGVPMAGDPRKGLVAGWSTHPTADIGLVVLNDWPDVWSAHALEADQVGPHPTGPSQDAALLIGSPAEAVVKNFPELGVTTQQYQCALEELRDSGDGRWLLEWKDGELIDMTVFEGAPRDWRQGAKQWEERLRGSRLALPRMRGMSGGGLWQVLRTPERGPELWYADRHLRLVGVQSKYRQPDAIIEPVSRWETWFHEANDAIDLR